MSCIHLTIHHRNKIEALHAAGFSAVDLKYICYKKQYHCNRQFIYRLRWRYDGLVAFWVRLYQRGYMQTIDGLYYFMERLGLRAKLRLKSPKEVLDSFKARCII